MGFKDHVINFNIFMSYSFFSEHFPQKPKSEDKAKHRIAKICTIFIVHTILAMPFK